ncbi:MAG TPA: TlpA family protein disulfide reductase [Clostridiales bacterium]|nr:TlpA family protein disulfide reductase [Clostridiales bacterium]
MTGKKFINGLNFAIITILLVIALSACSVSKQEEQPDNTNNAPSEETSGTEAKNPDEILKGYYYAKIDEPIVDFELEDLQGNKVRLSDFKGKIVFLNFWATWCPPCREEMPFMQELYEKYKDKDIVVLAVNPNQVENRGVDDSEKAEQKVREFIKENGYTFPILLDRDDSAWAVYQQRGIPANYVIDKEGVIKYLKPGAFTGLEEMEAFAEAIRAGA